MTAAVRNSLMGALAVVALVSGGLLWNLVSHPAKAETVRIGSFSVAIDYAPYLVAREQGRFQEVLGRLGIVPEYTIFQSLPSINEAFATGDIDVVFEAAPPAIIGRAAGIPIGIVGVGASLNQEIVVRRATGIDSLAELKGRKIAVLAGTSSHFGLLKSLESNGLSAEDVEVIDMVPPDARSAFETGQIDAWAVWPPFVEQIVIEGTGKVLPRTNEEIHSIVAMRSGFIENSNAAAVAIWEVIEQTKIWINAHPDEAIQIVARILDLDVVVVEEAWPKHDWGAQIGPPIVLDLQEKTDFLVEQGLVKNGLDIESQLLKSLMPNGTL